ncbi:rhodanese domain-containing protein CG4456 [Dendroctonus ponderosae]
MTSVNWQECDFAEINKARNDPTKLVIDVREMEELRNGQIAGSINIPLGAVPWALGPETSSDTFKRQYSAAKPEKECPIIFTCRSGVRSRKAQQEAIKLGYSNVTNYTGGWLDWEEKTKNKPTHQIS